jgi:acylphosphatase
VSAPTIRHVIIRGRVQGVGYRAWVEHTALGRALEGWVCNRRDGSVEAVFAGPVEAVDGMIEACRRGPSAARVIAIEQQPAAPDLLGRRRPGEAFSVLM